MNQTDEMYPAQPIYEDIENQITTRHQNFIEHKIIEIIQPLQNLKIWRQKAYKSSAMLLNLKITLMIRIARVIIHIEKQQFKQMVQRCLNKKEDEKEQEFYQPKRAKNLVDDQEREIIPLVPRRFLLRNGSKRQQRRVVTCQICYSDQYQSGMVLLNCGHSYCVICLNQMILYAIDQSGEVHKLKCPDFNCPAVLPRDTIESLIERSGKFPKYLRIMRNYYLVLEKTKKFCPAPNCDNVLEKKGLNSKINCEQCKNLICFDCHCVWHIGQTCRQYIKKTQINWALRDENTQKCPQCKVIIEKDEGCNHMTCYKCQHYFCWGCGFPVKHFIHDKDIQTFYTYGICLKEKYKTISIRKLTFIYLLLAIVAQFLSFLVLLIGGALFWIAGPYFLYGDILKYLKGPVVKAVVIYLLVISYPICIFLGLLTGGLFGSLYLAVGFFPIGIIHSYYLINIIRWRRQGRSFRGK
ncbi:ibr domain containing protein [Stylonychia lemnae]|uniref:RBR-type E3 ubiquitin transferase n=1 Tax=Stylonychia lemnae TaxID=5949 RepID=A0A078A5J3_STYLE|nr:ibr domain containing protein [Stylonychia lemnae]|eukprot:CDW77444.1 ibr domain containing protein [Stylonychia lemnae]